MLKRTALLVVTTMLAIAAVPTVAQDRPRSRPSTTQADGGGGEKSKNPISDKPSVTEHELRVGDHTLKYRATAAHMPLKDEAGKLRANFFYVAYERTGEDTPVDKRPITFVFNGGPGAASIWLHLGTAGPKRVDLTPEGFAGTPPYRLVDNPTTWLNQTDLVFIDPVGTGYSRAAEGVKGEEFYGVQQDLDSVSEFIRLYLVKNERWASPKFIAGESYGTTRAALLSEHLLDAKGIALNGVILISTVLSFQAISPSDANELPFELFFPTYTACAHYHKKLPDDLQKQDLAQTLKEVEKWVRETYSPALLAGDRLTAEQHKSLVATISRYTGLPEQFVEKANCRISPFAFEKALLEDQHKVIGRFDGRVTGSAIEPLDFRPEHDPSLTQYVGVYAGTFNDYARRELKFESDLQYEYLTGRVQPWNWGRGGNGGWLYVGDNLRNAVVKHPGLKVLVCSGHYDLATPYFATDYAISHLDVAPDLRKNIRQTYYEGGHMLYHHRPDLEKLNKDVADFMAWAQTPATQPAQQ